jgi:hypothetical protein
VDWSLDHQSSINWLEHFYVENGYMAVGVGQSSNMQFTLLDLQTANCKSGWEL